MTTCWERTAHSVYHMFSLYILTYNFSYFKLWFWGRDFDSDCMRSWSLGTRKTGLSPPVIFYITDRLKVVLCVCFF